MKTTATCNVDDLAASEKQSLEALLGNPLETGQCVFIMTYQPGVVPDEAVRQAARERIERQLLINQQHAEALGITAEEADQAIDEAISVVRRRS